MLKNTADRYDALYARFSLKDQKDGTSAEVQLDGTPVAIITLGANGEVEQPVALNVPDIKHFITRFLLCLADLGDPTAITILYGHLAEHPVDGYSFPKTPA